MKTLLITLTLIVTPTLAIADDAPPSTPIPTETTVGIGLGIENRQLGGLGGLAGPGVGLLSGPHVGSVRVRFPSGLSIEPSVAVGRSVAEQGGSVASATTLDLGAALRFGVARRGPVQLLGVAGARLTRGSTEAGDTTTQASSASASWGLAIDYWLQRHVALSVSATNPLVSHSVFAGSSGGMDQAALSSTTYGLSFDPTFAMMVHLFY